MESLVANLPTREKAWSICEAYFQVSSTKRRVVSFPLFFVLADLLPGLLAAFFQNGAWTYDSVSRSRFYESYFSSAYPSNRPQDISPPPQRPAVVFLVLALGGLFDLNSPPRKYETNRSSFPVLVLTASILVHTESQTSKKYFSMAKSALSLDSAASLTFIRAILLMSNFGKRSVSSYIGSWCRTRSDATHSVSVRPSSSDAVSHLFPAVE